MGAVIGMKEMPKSAKDEGFVAYMGPLFGLLSFLPAIPLYDYTHEPFWALLIILGGMTNLFNLIPITPLDGGRIAAGISTKLWGLGIILLFAYSIYHLSILGFIIVILGSREWYKLYKKQKRQLEVQELEHILEKLKQESHSLDSTQELVRKAKWKTTNMEMIKLLNTLNVEIEKMKKDHYLQKLSGAYSLSEEYSHQNQQVILGLLKQLEKRLTVFKRDVLITEGYYKTDKKTKLQLFLIYIGLVIALTISYYYGNQFLMNHPEIQKGDE